MRTFSRSRAISPEEVHPSHVLNGAVYLPDSMEGMRPEAFYVQYGCGWCGPLPLTWINFDASYTLRFERLPLIGNFYRKNRWRYPANVKYGDIVRGLPLPRQSCAGVYASHVLEHLTAKEFHLALGNTFRLLARGGIFRLVVPDLEAAA